MKRSSGIMFAACVASMALCQGAMAQGAPQTVARIDPSTLSTGFRASKVIGSAVTNRADQTVGTVNDLIITANGKGPYAILSVGGFLGVGTKYVAVPYQALNMSGDKVTMAGATKDSLEKLPTFTYN